MANDLSMARIVMLFIEGLSEPLHGWVSTYQPVTLEDTISKEWDMQDAVPKSRFLPKPTIPQRGEEVKQQQREPTGKNQLDDETRKYLRR